MQADPANVLPAAADEPAPLPVAAESLLRAQAIDCGGVPIAVPFSWARSVVEDFDVSPAPNAPAWLVGAVNVDGRILPVLDIAAWLDENAAQSVERRSKLLVGGEGEDRFALLFQGLPLMARYAADDSVAIAARGREALAPFLLGFATPSGQPALQHWPVVDARALGEHWVSELAA
jgi:chemotaxis signal transduction protein